MFDYIPSKGDVLSPSTCRVYKSSPDYADYLVSRFATNDASVFRFSGQSWVFSHSGADGQGMFDVLRKAEDSLAAIKRNDGQETDQERFMRDRTDVPGFFHINVPMSVLRSLLPPALTSGAWAQRSGRA